MKKFSPNEALDALIFIDANIYLDFYRARERSFEIAMIKHLNENRDKIITTDQVLMEYKKNRQQVIIKELGTIKTPEVNLSAPAFLDETKLVSTINREVKKLKALTSQLKIKIKNILEHPTQKDPLYKCLHKLFRDKKKYHLGRKDEQRHTIRQLAEKRCMLGYPPRKDTDTSIGDAINWEWIVECAKKAKKNIIIVSRDGDYGKPFEGSPILNDWLDHEFKDRVGKQRKIILTNKLSHAFKLTGISISKKEEDVEDELLNTNEYYLNWKKLQQSNWQKIFSNMNLHFSDYSDFFAKGKKNSNPESDTE